MCIYVVSDRETIVHWSFYVGVPSVSAIRAKMILDSGS